MTENHSAAHLVSRAIAGDFPAPIEEVRITKGYGEGVVITPLGKGNKPTKTNQKIEQHHALDDPKNTPGTVNPIDVSKTIADKMSKKEGSTAKAQPSTKTSAKQPTAATGSSLQAAQNLVEKVNGGSRSDQAQSLWNTVISATNKTDCMKAGQELVNLKSKSKVSWAKLGISDEQALDLRLMLIEEKPIPNTAWDKAKQEEDSKPAPSATPTPGNNQRHAHQLYSQGDFKALHDFKRAKKKSWEALGFSPTQTAEILRNLEK
jgi:hypothetical protein